MPISSNMEKWKILNGPSINKQKLEEILHSSCLKKKKQPNELQLHQSKCLGHARLFSFICFFFYDQFFFFLFLSTNLL